MEEENVNKPKKSKFRVCFLIPINRKLFTFVSLFFFLGLNIYGIVAQIIQKDKNTFPNNILFLVIGIYIIISINIIYIITIGILLIVKNNKIFEYNPIYNYLFYLAMVSIFNPIIFVIISIIKVGQSKNNISFADIAKNLRNSYIKLIIYILGFYMGIKLFFISKFYRNKYKTNSVSANQ